MTIEQLIAEILGVRPEQIVRRDNGPMQRVGSQLSLMAIANTEDAAEAIAAVCEALGQLVGFSLDSKIATSDLRQTAKESAAAMIDLFADRAEGKRKPDQGAATPSLDELAAAADAARDAARKATRDAQEAADRLAAAVAESRQRRAAK